VRRLRRIAKIVGMRRMTKCLALLLGSDVAASRGASMRFGILCHLQLGSHMCFSLTHCLDRLFSVNSPQDGFAMKG
jgi:hypothetical protein